jgi:hypothetical protein
MDLPEKALCWCYLMKLNRPIPVPDQVKMQYQLKQPGFLD